MYIDEDTACREKREYTRIENKKEVSILRDKPYNKFEGKYVYKYMQ